MDDHIMKAIETLAKGAEGIHQAFEAVSEQGLPNEPGTYARTSGGSWLKLEPAEFCHQIVVRVAIRGLLCGVPLPLTKQSKEGVLLAGPVLVAQRVRNLRAILN